MRETAFTRAAKWQRTQFYKSTSCSLFCFFTTILSLLDEGIKALEHSFGCFFFWKERCLNHPCSCCLCLASLPQCPQAQMVMVPPSLIKKDRGEDCTVSNEKAPNRIHIRIWRKSNVASPLWGDWFWLCPTFIQCTMQGTQKRKKTEIPMGKKYDATVFHQNPFLLKVYLYFLQHPEKVYDYFTICRNSFEVN